MLTFKQFKSTKQDQLTSLLEEFVLFAQERLQLEELPGIFLIKDGSMKSTFGCYSEGEISLNVLNRHPVDILRTLAHEMVHFRQDCDGELHERSGEDGSEHENEANSVAGVILREFGREHPELFNFGAILEDVNYETYLCSDSDHNNNV